VTAGFAVVESAGDPPAGTAPHLTDIADAIAHLAGQPRRRDCPHLIGIADAITRLARPPAAAQVRKRPARLDAVRAVPVPC
jgi:hypothetical protein